MDTLTYLSHRLKENDLPDYCSGIDWEKAKKINLIEFLQSQFNDPLLKQDPEIRSEATLGEMKKNVLIVYQKEIHPDFLKLRKIVHDGTLLFSFEALNEIMVSLTRAESYNKNNCPKDYGKDDIFWQYDVKYLISDLLWHSEYVDHVDAENGKMFPGEKDVFAMAVQIEYTKRSEL